MFLSDMYILSPSVIVSVLLVASVDANAQGTTSPATAAPAAEKPRALVGSELKLVKTGLERINVIVALTDKKRRESGLGEVTKPFAVQLSKDVQKLWGDLATLSTDSGQPAPTGPTEADQRKVSKVWKEKPGQRDREWCKLVSEQFSKLSDE